MSRRRATVRPSGSAPRTSRDWATRRMTSAAVVALARPTCQALPGARSRAHGRLLEREPVLADARRAGQRQRRCSRSRLTTWASSSSRPMNEVEAAGRLPRRGGATGTGAIAGSCARIAPGADAAQGRARVPAPPGGPAWPPGTPRARPPGVRSGRAPASAVPTVARGTGFPAQRGPPQRPRRALPARAPPRSPPTHRAEARPAASPRPAQATEEGRPMPGRARGERGGDRVRGSTCITGAERAVAPRAAPRTGSRRPSPCRAYPSAASRIASSPSARRNRAMVLHGVSGGRG